MKKLIVWIFLFTCIKISLSQGVGVGENAFVPHSSAILEVKSNQKGVLIPRLTTAQRDAIVNPVISLLIYNTTVGCFQFWDGNQWISMFPCAGGCIPPEAPTTQPASNITPNLFTANWTSINGATTYYLDVSLDSAFTMILPGYNNTNVGNVTNYSVTGLTCETNYYYRVRAENACGLSGNSNVTAVTTGICTFCMTIGGPGDDEGASIARTNDGGIVIAGSTTSYGSGNYDIYVVKLTPTFSLEWTKAFGGVNEELGYDIIQTSDLGYVVAARSYTFNSEGKAYVAKLNALGNLSWNKLESTDSPMSKFVSIIQTSDGGYAMCGRSYFIAFRDADFYLVKMSSTGTMEWNTCIGGNSYNWDHAFKVIQTTDGGFALAGTVESFGQGSYDGCVAKLSSTGTLQWFVTIGGTGEDYLRTIAQTSDGGYIVGGWTKSYGVGNNDMYVIKLSSTGTLEWTKTIGGNNDDQLNDLIIDSDNGYVLVGGTKSFGAGGNDAYIVKLTPSGTIDWTRTVGGSNDDVANRIVKMDDGGYLVVGYTKSFGAGNNDIFLIKLDAQGNTCCGTGSGGILGSGGIWASHDPSVHTGGTFTEPTPTFSHGGDINIQCP